jgi:carboxylate-amine ligase
MHLPSFTLGIEEEYLLVDPQTMDLASDPPPSMIEECQRRCEGQVVPEFLRSQIEVGTPVCADIGQAREELVSLRRAVIEVAQDHGLAVIAASSHPFANWSDQIPTPKERYSLLEAEMRAAARRLLICGMHVHVGIDNDALRIDLMNQLKYFLPHLLALSTSSPFWEGDDTGLKSYRLTVFDALPRTGLPEHFASYAEYQRHLSILIDAGLLQDGSKIWWDLRPSSRYPTLETRIFDVCTSVNDALSLAALVTCILRMLCRLRSRNQRWRVYSRMLINENRWRAMRYGFDEGLIDLAKGCLVSFDELFDELTDLLSEDVRALGCEREIEHLRGILQRGTSAHRQIKVYEAALALGSSKEEAMSKVVEHLIEETARLD